MPNNDVDQWAQAGAQALQQIQAEQVRNNVASAVGTNADQAAHYQHLAAFLGVPVDTVHAEPEAIKQQAALKSMDADKLVSGYPTLAKYLTDPDNTAKSHDDIAPLAAVEQAAKALPAPAATAKPPSFGDTVAGLPMDLAKGLGGAFSKAAGSVNMVLGAFPTVYDKAASLMTGKPTTAASDAWFKGMVDPRVNQANSYELAPNAPFVSKAVHTAGNLAGMLSQIVLTGGGGEAAGAAGTTAEVIGNQMAHGAKSMAFPAISDSVDTGRRVYAETGDAQQALRAAQMQYATSTAAGVVPLSAPGGIATRLAGGFVSGVASGETSRGAMNLVLPTSMQQPFDVEGMLLSGLSGSMLGGVMGARGEPAYHDAVRQTYVDASKAEASEQGMAALQGLSELATASKTRERDPEAFKAFVKSATEDGQLQEVYVDANAFADVLNQSGVSIDALAKTMPEVAAQFREAVQTNGDIRIPVEDYATHIAGGKIDAALLPHLKVEPEGFTYHEGQAYLENQKSDMQAQAAKILTDKETGDAAKADAQVVHDKVLDQLNGAARFRPEVNNAYAALSRDFYTTMAERTGLTPSELYERYPLKVTSEALGGGRLDQVGDQRELVVQHNLTAANLLHAHKQGGMAVPSLAITKASNPLHGFGEISLLGGKEMIDPKTAGNKVFGADIYSPRYPSVGHKVGTPELKSINAAIKPFKEFGGSDIYASEIGNDAVSGLLERNAVKAAALADMGVEVKPVLVDGKLDEWKTTMALRNAIHEHDAYSKVEAFARKLLADAGAQERIFTGYSRTGNQTFVPHTLENVIKILQKELRGGENFNYGVGTVRSKFTPQFKSIDQIIKNKDKLVDSATFEKVKAEIGEEFDATIEALKPFHSASDKFGFSDTVSMMMSDSAKSGVPRALEMNGFKDVPVEMQKKVAEFLTKLRELPTEYFEAKALRAVPLSEFKTAVVPEGTDQKVLDALAKSGVTDIRTYKKGDEADRTAKIQSADHLLFQGNRGGFNPETNTISLLHNADLSTYLHESGHFFLETMHDMAGAADAPEGIRADFDTLLKSFGEKGDTPEQRLADWSGKTLDEKRDGHEQFARRFEAYLMEGKAPTLEMQGVFSRFRSWLVNVYKSLSNLNVELSPEVRGVMDRLLASDEAIKQAEQARGYTPMATPPEGTTAEQFAAYQEAGKEATDQAIADMTARSLRDMQWASNAKSKALRALQKRSDAERKAIREQVTKEVEAEPVRQAEAYLKREGGTDPAPAAEAKEWATRRDAQRATLAEAVKAEYLASPEGAAVKGLKKGQFLAKNKRAIDNEAERRTLAWEQENPRPVRPVPDNDVVAEMFGFTDGKALKKAIAAAGKLKDQIDGMTDQRMLEQHGELVDVPSVERAAEAAIHNEARARFMATGLKILTNSPIPARQIAKGAAEAAAAAIAAKRVRELRPAQHAAAEVRTNREALKLAPHDPAGAAQAQRAALLNNRLFKAASDAVAEVQKGVEYLKKFDKDSVRGKIALDIRDQIDDLLSRFDLRQKVPDGLTRKQVNLQQWVESQVAAGYSPSVTADMLNPGVRMHFKDMTVEQFRGLVDSIKAMEFIGKKRQELTIGGARVDLDDYVATKLMPKLQERGERFSKADLVDRPEDRTTNPFALALDRFNAWRRAAAAQLKPTEFKRNQYDRHELLGPMGEAIFDPVLNANYHKVDMLKGLSDDFQKLANDQGKDWQKSLRDMVENTTLIDPDKSAPGAQVMMRISRAKMIGMAIHVGNESNFNKLTAGWGWKPEAVWSFLHEHMTEKDWAATQGVWDLYEKHWPDMEAMNRRLGNTSPEKIEPRAFPTKFGDQRGGYAAIAYDALRSRRGEKEAQIRAVDPTDGLFGRGYFKADTTTNGSMNGRIDGYTDRVELDFHHIATRMHETIHDLAYRETAIDVHKVLEHPEFRAAFRTAYGPEAYKSMQEWLGKVVNSENGDQQVGALGKFLQYTRTGMVMTAIALRASTVLKHGGSAGIKTTGYFLGGGEKYLASRFASMGTDYKAQISGAQKKFGEIRARLLQQDRDFRVTSTALFEAEHVQAKAERFGHAAVAWSDMMTAVPTAWAAYDRAITEGIPVSQGGTGAPMTEAQAVNYANKIVREAHGSNIETARSMALNTSSEALKMFTTLYGFMNTSYGQALDGFDKLGTAGIGSSAVLARSFMALIVPALWAHTLTHGAPGDDEGWGAWIGKAVAGEVAGMVPFVRDVVAMVEGYSHAGVVGAESWMSTIVKAAMDVKHLAEGKEVKAPIKDIANAAGMGLHIPGLGQLGTSAQYAADVAAGKEHPADAAEYAKGIALGHGAKHH